MYALTEGNEYTRCMVLDKLSKLVSLFKTYSFLNRSKCPVKVCLIREDVRC